MAGWNLDILLRQTSLARQLEMRQEMKETQFGEKNRISCNRPLEPEA